MNWGYLVLTPMRAALIALLSFELAHNGVSPSVYYVLAGVWAVICLFDILIPRP